MGFSPFKNQTTIYTAITPQDGGSAECGMNSEDDKASCELLSPKLRGDDYAGHDSSHRGRLLLLINLLILSLSTILLLATVQIYLHASRSHERSSLARLVSEHSPIFDHLDITLKTTKMNATLLEPNPPTIFRQLPSPEVDAAWRRLANVRPIALTREDVLKVGKDPAQASKWPESFGFGPDSYIGRIDVFHQIHCLDSLRREAYFDHYYGKKWPNRNTSELHQTHLSHCIYLLLQNLMCTANVDVYTHFWADAQLNAFPDFSLNHKCRDFEAILTWQEENSVPVPEFEVLRRPDDYEARVMTHRFKELFGWLEEHEDDGLPGEVVA